MEVRHLESLQNGVEIGDIYKVFLFEDSTYERTPYEFSIKMYAHDYDGYVDDEGIHHTRFLWVDSRGRSIEIAITAEHYVRCAEDHPKWDGTRANDGTPLRKVENTLVKKEVGSIGEYELYAEIERCIDEVL
jgi:hypothetical protein